ncbi:MAG: ribonuclease HI family protein [Patescibacteria group bacterium]|jgi:ribonuclease HI
MATYIVHTDGGSRGNPGTAGAGAVIANEAGQELATVAKPLGVMTNNQAEYWGVIFAFERLLELVREAGDEHPTVKHYLDSQLIAEQLAGRYKMKNPGLKPLFDRVRSLILELGGSVTSTHVPRAQNARADALANEAMDVQGRME